MPAHKSRLGVVLGLVVMTENGMEIVTTGTTARGLNMRDFALIDAQGRASYAQHFNTGTAEKLIKAAATFTPAAAWKQR